jgi:preprotein translocase subunit SecG
MQTLHTVLVVVQVLVALGLIGFILIQHGKGADAGAAFGSGASATVFGSRGSGNFLTRGTTVLAFIFLLNSLALAWIARQRIDNQQSLMDHGEAALTEPAGASSAAPDDSASTTSAAAPAEGAATASDIPVDAATAADAAAAPEQAADVPVAPEQAADVPAAPPSQ